jgi:hypothetical protein
MAKAVVLSIKNHVKRAEPAKRRRRALGEKSIASVSPLQAEKPRLVRTSEFPSSIVRVKSLSVPIPPALSEPIRR